jgi:transcriptional regulator with XRE-family HTH domain
MVDWKSVNDRKKRAEVLRTIVGDDVGEGTRIALEAAEGAEEAARFVREMREAAKLTQTALGRKIGISQARVSEIERGGTPEGISYATLRRVARACGFTDWPVTPTARAEQQSAKSVQPVEPVKVDIITIDATGLKVAPAALKRQFGSMAKVQIAGLGGRVKEGTVHEHLVLMSKSRAKDAEGRLARKRRQVREISDALSKSFTVIKGR